MRGDASAYLPGASISWNEQHSDFRRVPVLTQEVLSLVLTNNGGNTSHFVERLLQTT